MLCPLAPNIAAYHRSLVQSIPELKWERSHSRLPIQHIAVSRSLIQSQMGSLGPLTADYI